MAVNPLASDAKSPPNLNIATTSPNDPHSHDLEVLTERQKRRRFEKTVVKRGFEGTIIIDRDPGEATRHANLEYSNASRWGVKDSRMVLWATGITHAVEAGLRRISGLGIVSYTSPDSDQWVWEAYHVTQEIDSQMAEFLAVAMALQVARVECVSLAGIEMPSKVVVYSSSKDALLRMKKLDFVMQSGVRMPKAGVRVVETGLVAAHFIRNLGIEVELRWVPDGCEINNALESNRAASAGAKHKPPAKGPDAFIKDVGADRKRRRKARNRRESKLREKKETRRNQMREQTL